MSLMVELYSARSYSPIPPPMPSPQLLPLPLPSPPPYPRHNQRRPSTSHAGTGSRTRNAGVETPSSPSSSRFPLDRALLAVDPACRTRPRTATASIRPDRSSDEDASRPPLQVKIPIIIKKETERREPRRESRHSQESRRSRHPSSSPAPLSPVNDNPHPSPSRRGSFSISRSSSQPRKLVATTAKAQTPPVPPLPRSASDSAPPLSPSSPHSRSANKPFWLSEPPIKANRQAGTITSQSLPNPGFAGGGGRGQNRNSTSTSSTISWKRDDPSEKQVTTVTAPLVPKECKRESRTSRAANGIMSPILRSFKSLPNVRSPKPDGNSPESKHKQGR